VTCVLLAMFHAAIVHAPVAPEEHVPKKRFVPSVTTPP